MKKKIPPPIDFHIEDNLAIIRQTWTSDIQKYCDFSGCDPYDLIDAHRNQNKPVKGRVRGKEVPLFGLTQERAVVKAYDPYKNQTFKNKYGIK